MLVTHTIRENLGAFVIKAYATIKGRRLEWDPPYLDALIFELTKVAFGATNQLLVSMPPRHGKTFVASTCFPAWLLLHQPSLEIMIVTYGDKLCEEIVTP